MAVFQIQVRERAERTQFVAFYQIEADTLEAAIEAATARFRNENPDRNIDNYSFERAKH